MKLRSNINLNYYERRILQVLRFSFRLLNTKEVAYYAKIDWVTADKYLKALRRKGYIGYKKVGRVNYWKIK